MSRTNGKPKSDRYQNHEAHCCRCRERCRELEAAIARLLVAEEQGPPLQLSSLAGVIAREELRHLIAVPRKPEPTRAEGSDTKRKPGVKELREAESRTQPI